jgi:hypothetical protein
MYYIFNTKQDALSVNEIISKEQGYMGNITTDWCSNPIELTDGRFAMPYIEVNSDMSTDEILEDISSLRKTTGD